MNIAKFIRVLGYILYNILWLPAIVLYITIAPIVSIGLSVRAGKSVKRCWNQIVRTLSEAIAHDLVFIQTGKW